MNFTLLIGAVLLLVFVVSLYSMFPILRARISEPFSTKPVMTLFYVPWCPHCKRMKGEWDLFAKTYKNSDKVEVKTIDMEKPENNPLRERYEIKSYPTIVLEKNGEMIRYPQEGERNQSAFESWIQKHI